jgi:hypothetical protein
MRVAKTKDQFGFGFWGSNPTHTQPSDLSAHRGEVSRARRLDLVVEKQLCVTAYYPTGYIMYIENQRFHCQGLA